MNTVADPARDPTFTFFGNPNFFFEGTSPTIPPVGTGFAWNHGDDQPEIAHTFIGIVGPGVRTLGVTQPADFLSDHVDLRPTMMYLTGLTDDYQHDGRVILELLDPEILTKTLHSHSDTLLQLGRAPAHHAGSPSRSRGVSLPHIKTCQRIMLFPGAAL